MVENGHTHFSKTPFILTFRLFEKIQQFRFPLWQTPEVKVWDFSRLYTIMDAILAWSAFAVSARWNTPDATLLAATPLVATISVTIAGREPKQFLRSHAWGLVLELARNHESLSSIHTHWGSQTCFAGASCPRFGDMLGENVVQLPPLLEVKSLVWSAQPLPYGRTYCIEFLPK